MDFKISDEQRAFIKTVRKVCQNEFAPRAIQYLDGTWPAENMRRLAELGVLGMAVPQVHGGYGFTDEFAVSRFFRSARYGSLGGGTTETLRNLVGKKLIEDLDLASGCFGR